MIHLIREHFTDAFIINVVATFQVHWFKAFFLILLIENVIESALFPLQRIRSCILICTGMLFLGDEAEHGHVESIYNSADNNSSENNITHIVKDAVGTKQLFFVSQSLFGNGRTQNELKSVKMSSNHFQLSAFWQCNGIQCPYILISLLLYPSICCSLWGKAFRHTKKNTKRFKIADFSKEGHTYSATHDMSSHLTFQSSCRTYCMTHL